MKLKFYARGDLLVTKPGFVPKYTGGDVPRYVGRKFVARNGNTPAHNIATKEPAEFDSESEAGRRLMLLCRRDSSLWPADQATADACGVKFVPVDFKDGEWVAKPLPVASAKRATSAE